MFCVAWDYLCSKLKGKKSKQCWPRFPANLLLIVSYLTGQQEGGVSWGHWDVTLLDWNPKSYSYSISYSHCYLKVIKIVHSLSLQADVHLLHNSLSLDKQYKPEQRCMWNSYYFCGTHTCRLSWQMYWDLPRSLKEWSVLWVIWGGRRRQP